MHASFLRTQIKELESYQQPLRQLTIKMRITAQSDEKYSSFLADVTKASLDLDAYVAQSLDSIWEFEALPLEQATKEHLDKALSGFNNEVKMSKHHLIGCKAAKQRFSGILAIEV